MQIGTMQLNGSADLNVTKNNLLFKGSYHLNGNHHFDFSSIRNLQAKGFHVSTSIIPTAANDSLKSFLFKTFIFFCYQLIFLNLNAILLNEVCFQIETVCLVSMNLF